MLLCPTDDAEMVEVFADRVTESRAVRKSAEGECPFNPGWEGTTNPRADYLGRVSKEHTAARLVRTNPCVGVAIPRSPRSEMLFIDAAEVEALAHAIEAPYGTLVRFAAYTGLRAGEIAALRVRRLSLLRGSVDVRESVTEVRGALLFGETKTGARPSVALPRFLCDELAVHLAAHGIDTKPDELVFASPDGGPLRQSNFYRRTFKPAVLRSGLPAELRFHDLRHTAVALLVTQGAHPLAVKERLGHSSITTTMDRYGHLFPSLDESLTEGLDIARAAAVAANHVEFSLCPRPPLDVKKARSAH